MFRTTDNSIVESRVLTGFPKRSVTLTSTVSAIGSPFVITVGKTVSMTSRLADSGMIVTVDFAD